MAREIQSAINESRRITGRMRPIAILLDVHPDCAMCIGRATDGRTVLVASREFVREVYRAYGRPAVWGGVFHELHHAQAGHLIAPSTDFGVQWPREIACDIFAERVLVRLGMDPEPFARMLDGFGSDISKTHPAGSVRATAARDAARLEGLVAARGLRGQTAT